MGLAWRRGFGDKSVPRAERQRSSRATARASRLAVAARPRQPADAGAERVPQVEQHRRRLPEAVIRASYGEQGQKVLAS